jgi:hypothetical protein
VEDRQTSRDALLEALLQDDTSLSPSQVLLWGQASATRDPQYAIDNDLKRKSVGEWRDYFEHDAELIPPDDSDEMNHEDHADASKMQGLSIDHAPQMSGLEHGGEGLGYEQSHVHTLSKFDEALGLPDKSLRIVSSPMSNST